MYSCTYNVHMHITRVVYTKLSVRDTYTSLIITNNYVHTLFIISIGAIISTVFIFPVYYAVFITYNYAECCLYAGLKL